MGTSTIDANNPVGLDGVDFVEYTGPSSSFFHQLFEKFGFQKTATIAGKQISLYEQNNIRFILNTQPGSFASQFAELHGPSICSTGFRVKNAKTAFQTAVKNGARPFEGSVASKGIMDLPAVYGIGDSLIYFIDDQLRQELYQDHFHLLLGRSVVQGVGLKEVDHFTNNVPVGEMQKWCDFYQKVFHFRETRYFHIQGKQTGLQSRVMRSPCGKFSVPINEPTEKKSQIQEYLDEYKGSGIQHLALLTEDVVTTLEAVKKNQIEFLTPPPGSYYQMLKERVPGITEDLDRLQKNAILVDGDDQGYLLQIFTKNIIGPIFYELIQRKNHFGFGEGNFQALFDAIERDQKQRGYL